MRPGGDEHGQGVEMDLEAAMLYGEYERLRQRVEAWEAKHPGEPVLLRFELPRRLTQPEAER